ncbi:MAG: YidH family protein [Nitrospira sp.]
MEGNGHRESPEDPRIRLAGERTLLAWIRTGLALMGLGFVVARFDQYLREIGDGGSTASSAFPGLLLWLGSALVILGVAVNVLASLEHFHFLRHLDKGEPYRARQWSLGIAVSVLLATLGIGLVTYLLLSNH